MKTENVLTHHVLGWPELLKSDGLVLLLVTKAERGDVVRQCFEPDVHRVAWIVGYWDAPTDRGLRTTDGKILKSARHKTLHFISPSFRSHEIGPCLIKFEQFLVVIRKTKEIAFLRNPIELGFVNQAGRRFARRRWWRVFIFGFIRR